MNLDLPSRIPLPDDVRGRALDRVLAGIESPAPRWWARPEPLVAAVAAVLVIGVSVVVTLSVARPAPELLLPAAAPLSAAPLSAAPFSEGGPIPSPVPLESLDRCRAAIPDPEGAGYPPAAQWRETDHYNLGVDSVMVIDDRFACHLGARIVTVSPLEGAPIGNASLVRLAPAVLAVLNPQRESVAVSGGAAARDGGDPGVIIVYTDEVFGEDYRITVGDSYDGPPPPVLPEGRPFVDRDLPSRTFGESDQQIMDTEACVATVAPAENSESNLWIPLFAVDTVEPRVQVMAIGDLFAGFCILAPDGPQFVPGGPLPGPDTEGGLLAYSSTTVAPGGASDGTPDRILVAVPAGTNRVDITGDLPNGGNGGTTCALDGTLAFCELVVVPGTTPSIVAFEDAPGGGSTGRPIPF